MLRLLERIDCTFCQMVFPDWSDMSDAHLQMTLRSSLGVGNVYQLCRLQNYFHDIFYKIMFGRMTCLGNDIPHLLPAHLGWVVIDMCAGCMCIADHSASVAFAACCSGSCEWKGSSLKSVQHNFGIFLCVVTSSSPLAAAVPLLALSGSCHAALSNQLCTLWGTESATPAVHL